MANTRVAQERPGQPLAEAGEARQPEPQSALQRRSIASLPYEDQMRQIQHPLPFGHPGSAGAPVQLQVVPTSEDSMGPETGTEPSADDGATTFAAAADHNNRIPSSQTVLESLQQRFPLPEGATFTPEICEWIAGFQQRHGIDSDTPGQLDERTLLFFEEEMRTSNSEERSDGDQSGRERDFYLAVQADLLWPPSQDPAALYEHYAALILRAGGRVNPPDPDHEGRNLPTVLGIRGLAIGERDTESESNPFPERAAATAEARVRTSGYSDTFVVLRHDTEDSETLATEHYGDTCPAQNYFDEPLVPLNLESEEARDDRLEFDINDDQFNDVGMLRPGDYDVDSRSNFKGNPAYQVRRRRETDDQGNLVDPETGLPIDEDDLGDVPVWRNRTESNRTREYELVGAEIPPPEQRLPTDRLETNDDGEEVLIREVPVIRGDNEYRASERAASETPGSEREVEGGQVDDVMGDYAKGVLFHPGNSRKPSSVGCQTLHPDEYTRFLGSLGEEEGADHSTQDFTYILIDAREFLLAHPDFVSPVGSSE